VVPIIGVKILLKDTLMPVRKRVAKSISSSTKSISSFQRKKNEAKDAALKDFKKKQRADTAKKNDPRRLALINSSIRKELTKVKAKLRKLENVKRRRADPGRKNINL
jgi:hypothetical protein